MYRVLMLHLRSLRLNLPDLAARLVCNTFISNRIAIYDFLIISLFYKINKNNVIYKLYNLLHYFINLFGYFN